MTTILSSSPKEWLGRWRGQVGNWEADRIMNEALDKGSKIHSAFANLIEGAIILYSNANKRKGIEGFKTEQYNKQQLEYHFKAFLDQFNIWIKKANKSPKVFDLPSLLSMN